MYTFKHAAASIFYTVSTMSYPVLQFIVTTTPFHACKHIALQFSYKLATYMIYYDITDTTAGSGTLGLSVSELGGEADFASPGQI